MQKKELSNATLVPRYDYSIIQLYTLNDSIRCMLKSSNKNDVNVIKDLIDRGLKPNNSQNDHDHTLNFMLRYIINNNIDEMNAIKLINLLIKNGAIPDHNNTLNYALKTKRIGIIEMISWKQQDITLSHIIECIIKYIEEFKFQYNKKYILMVIDQMICQGVGPDYNTFALAIKTKEPEIVYKILQTNPQVNNVKGQCLNDAIKTSNIEIIRIALQYGACPNLGLDDENSLLCAIRTLKLKIVFEIVAHGGKCVYVYSKSDNVQYITHNRLLKLLICSGSKIFMRPNYDFIDKKLEQRINSFYELLDENIINDSHTSYNDINELKKELSDKIL